jgi:hypothetical protein
MECLVWTIKAQIVEFNSEFNRIVAALLSGVAVSRF